MRYGRIGDDEMAAVLDAQLSLNHTLVLRVSAASVNFPDLLMVAGKYQYKPVLPFIPGLEAAGMVIDCGPDVHRS